ncbi:hypothetical protein [Kosakonia cowanii]|uniref:hypothetical protein n=1 Tax=Kosakonia cowanii TaxID=208223 RepID=UPI0021E7B39B|nr:hypothetical protein [Kosakonia cowanii]
MSQPNKPSGKNSKDFIVNERSRKTDAYSNKRLPSASESEGYDSSIPVPAGKAVFESYGDNRTVNVKKGK